MHELKLDVIRRASVVSKDRFSQKDDDEIDNDLVLDLHKAKILPVYKSKNGISWAECIFQLFFSIQGPAFFVLPGGFKDVGYLMGILGAFGVAIFYIYMMQLYLWCEKELRRRHKIIEETHLSIYSMVELVFMNTAGQRRLAKVINAYLKYEIILSWSFSLSFAQLFICQNVGVILRYFNYKTSDRIILLSLFPMTTLISWVPNLKVMSSIAYFSSLMMVLVMFEIIFFIIVDPSPVSQVEVIGDMSKLSTFLATVFFTIVATPLVFPLKNEMKEPKKFGNLFGSFSSSMMILIILNVFFSLFGYIKYGQETSDNILENLPGNPIMMASNGLLTLAMIAGGAISFFVVFETVWNDELELLFCNSPNIKLYEYAARTLINLLITLVPLIIPTCEIFVNLISSFSYPFDSIVVPILLQAILLWRALVDYYR
ncbi:hypothetical protein V9T40_012985 [Parthenolecanium corni]|uniref:Amino acid transporter transmembrane domain-containing protein n=1 Tax=Parthenolecanium corni TaxID=536013 RepID=A0AAN9T9T5_9HEMI